MKISALLPVSEKNIFEEDSCIPLLVMLPFRYTFSPKISTEKFIAVSCESVQRSYSNRFQYLTYF